MFVCMYSGCGCLCACVWCMLVCPMICMCVCACEVIARGRAGSDGLNETKTEPEPGARSVDAGSPRAEDGSECVLDVSHQ